MKKNSLVPLYPLAAATRAAVRCVSVGAMLSVASLAFGANQGDRVISPSALYQDYCAVCHGERGNGNSRASNSLQPPPRDFTSPSAKRELSRERMILSITEGRPNTAMTAWKSQLSAPQIEALADFIRARFMGQPTARSDNRGAQLYRKNCSVCHGDGGAGSLWASKSLNPPPRDFSSPAAAAELTRERMIASVAHGRPGTAMAGFQRQLSGEDITAVVDYVREALMRAQPAPPAQVAIAQAASPATLLAGEMPAGLKGDAARGKRFYLDNCATCHGAKGDGNGPRAYFINPKPRDFLTAESRQRFSRPALFYAVAHGKLGTEMPAWNKVLADQEIANVAEFVFQAFVTQDQRAAK